jgi:hypothetical protein
LSPVCQPVQGSLEDIHGTTDPKFSAVTLSSFGRLERMSNLFELDILYPAAQSLGASSLERTLKQGSVVHQDKPPHNDLGSSTPDTGTWWAKAQATVRSRGTVHCILY